MIERFNEEGSTDLGFDTGGRIVENFTPQGAQNDCYVGPMRINVDVLSADCSFGNVQFGAMLSLDGLGGLLPHQREWATALALDNRGHIVFVGPRARSSTASMRTTTG